MPRARHHLGVIPPNWLATNAPPASWLVGVQVAWLGYYLPVSTFVLLVLLELLAGGALLLAVALITRRLTGRTVVDLLRGRG